MNRCVGLGLGVVGIALSGWAAASAQTTDRVTLRWSAPEGCPDGAAVIAEMDRLLGASTARPARPIDVAASVVTVGEGAFRVHIETPGEGGPRTREVKGASCSGVADATALILAFMIDPTAAASASPRATPAEISTVAPATPTSTATSPPTAAPSASVAPGTGAAGTAAPIGRPPSSARGAVEGVPPITFRLSVTGLLDAGSLPGVSFAFSGAGALLIGPYRLELGAAGWPDRTALLAADTGPGVGGSVGLLVGFVSLCRDVLSLVTTTDHFELSPCAAFEVGRLRAIGFGVDAPTEGAALWSAARAGGLFVWAPIRRVGIDLRVEAAVPFARPTFVIDGAGPVHRSGVVAGRLSLGAEVRF